MPRAPFDTTCDLIFGPAKPFAGTVYATGPCRFVPLRAIFPLLSPLLSTVGYITMDFAAPFEALVSNVGLVYTTNYGFADLIGLPSGHAANYRVLWVERVVYRSHPVYFRVWVEPYP